VATFKSPCGQTIHEDTRKRKIEKDGILYLRVPKPKYKSRQTRLDEVLQSLQELSEDIQTTVGLLDIYEVDDDGIPKEEEERSSFEKEKERILGMMEGLEAEDLECLAQEMEDWQSNMEGTNLEMTDKYTEVSECAECLREGVDTFEGLESPENNDNRDTFTLDTDCYRDELESLVQEMESICFPGMF
jgi:hypothetical protein